MKLTIAPADKTVCIDGVSYQNINMDWIPEFNETKVHAVQWDEDHGEIELVTADPNIEIKDLGIFKKAIKLWQQKHEEFLKFEEERIQREKEYEQEQIKLKKELEETEEQAKLLEDEEMEENLHLYYDIEELLKEI
jgi:hypothetical protein